MITQPIKPYRMHLLQFGAALVALQPTIFKWKTIKELHYSHLGGSGDMRVIIEKYLDSRSEPARLDDLGKPGIIY